MAPVRPRDPADALGGLGLKRHLRAWWSAWLVHARRIAEYQSAILLGLIYLVVAGPVWLVIRVTGRRLMPYGRDPGSTWLPRRSDPRTLADLERPY